MKRNGERILIAGYFSCCFFYFLAIWTRAFRYDSFNNLVAGNLNVWGDWAVHFTMGSAMAFRSLFLAESPLLWHGPFRYPYLANMLSAALIRAGMPFLSAFTVPSFLLSLFLAAVLFIFYRNIFKTSVAAIFGSLIFLWNGGLGFLWFVKDVALSPKPWQTLVFPPRAYTNIDASGIHWISVIDSMILPQRAFQLGFPLGLLSLLFLYQAISGERAPFRKALAAGILWGVMPLAHTHSFVAMGVLIAVWAAGDVEKENSPLWLLFFESGLCVAVPLVFSLHFLGGGGPSSIQWFPGWYANGAVDWLKFWAKNWGITPVIASLGAWRWFARQPDPRSKRRAGFFALSFVALFVVLNLFLLQMWVWDNSKLLVWVSVGASGFAGYWFSTRKDKTLAAALFLLMTASGAVDAYRLLIPRLNAAQLYSNEDLFLADWVKENTDPSSLWLSGTHHNNWLFNLTGRRVFMTYEGWLWTHGYSYSEIAADVDRMFHAPEDQKLYEKYGVDFIAIGPVEKKRWNIDLSKFDRLFTAVKRTENQVIYSTGRSALLSKEAMFVDPALPLAPVQAWDENKEWPLGLSQKMFPNIYFYGPSRSSIVASPRFHYDQERGKPFASPFSLEITGYLRVLEEGVTTFQLESDDGAWLYLDDRLVIDNGGVHAVASVSNRVRLLKGLHKIRVKYFDRNGGAILTLRWKTPSGVDEIIRPDAFYH